MEEVLKDFCYECMSFESEYTLEKRPEIITIRGEEHTIELTTAICKKCGESMTPHGILDKNIEEIEEYCTIHGIPFNRAVSSIIEHDKG